jgi:magnesium transporter
MAQTRLYRDGNLVLENFPPADISDHLESPDSLIWLDLCQPSEADLAMISEEFSLHELAVEDAVQRRQRPKLDSYTTHLFMSVHVTRLDPETAELTTIETATFVTDRALITVRSDPQFQIEEVTRRWDEGSLPITSVGMLLHGLLDYVVDSHFATVESLDDELDRLEDMLFDDVPHTSHVQRRSFQLRKSLVLLRRVDTPMREVVNSLLRRDLTVNGRRLVTPEMMPYYQDIYDHVLRVADLTDSLRDLVSTVLETNLTIQGNRMNSIMKQVTSWAAVIAVPTAVTGFYGQNVPYPGYGHWSGFVFSTLVIVGLSAGLILLFRRKDWI